MWPLMTPDVILHIIQNMHLYNVSVHINFIKIGWWMNVLEKKLKYWNPGVLESKSFFVGFRRTYIPNKGQLYSKIFLTKICPVNSFDISKNVLPMSNTPKSSWFIAKLEIKISKIPSIVQHFTKKINLLKNKLMIILYSEWNTHTTLTNDNYCRWNHK